ncbi:MAG TPA: mandelate racemase/muconate lactonizing enzyme family protein [Dehalococcoidia bacterium]|jgi:galactonate dehydratase|nr:galactonate dehydratase [Chloroflexota bacterium]MDP5877371.1 mandelate racemase/muconate lactonizing enzyme family protein [Dehalococcoidia bacterium]MDP6273361.1 mandelate racemase/muconate lactonizing enzyme family protein [Dehalococcoidia bacterium]MDP7160032.1 mandelate racemase/muconate lactonizing enzyme family protein [Dehalococcoidia bacterium]MDP7212350.1 mandelate racemase/muconate lactonizing enzyme family protein [Dehalococcoidia bacterium]|tara:strand:+ start:2438 stop:3583 length:1146 start_codon:yes stop_codon:yes gene_type:complete
MKITDVKPYAVWVGHRNQMLVKVETDEGIYGWGESGFSGRELGVKGVVEHYREWLIGKDPMRRGALWQEMYRSQYFEGGRTLTAAISAIDIALHDIVGKNLGVPVYELLGGKNREQIPVFATTRTPYGPEMIAEARDFMARGITAFRMSYDTMGIDTDGLFEPRESMANSAEWLVKTREALGNHAVIGIDYHHRLNVAEAASFCQMMPSHTLDFIEEPIRDETPEAYEQLRALTDIPFAIGEEFASKWQFLPYIERGITNFARVDICNVGGFTESMKVAGWAEIHYIDLMPHNPLGPVCTAASVHLGAAVPNFSWLEVNMERAENPNDEIFPEQILFEGNGYAVPDGPGLGVEVDESKLNEPLKFWEPPHLHRRDGSHTNW